MFFKRNQKMSRKLTEKQQIRKIIVGGLRDTIKHHGPITRTLIGSAAKRIVGVLLAKRKRDESRRI